MRNNDKTVDTIAKTLANQNLETIDVTCEEYRCLKDRKSLYIYNNLKDFSYVHISFLGVLSCSCIQNLVQLRYTPRSCGRDLDGICWPLKKFEKKLDASMNALTIQLVCSLL